MNVMRRLTGRGVASEVGLGGELDAGTPVAAPASDPKVSARLSAAEQDELSAAFDEAHAGDFEDGFALLSEIEEAWRTEIKRRLDAWERGETSAISAEAFLARLDGQIGGPR